MAITITLLISYPLCISFHIIYIRLNHVLMILVLMAENRKGEEGEGSPGGGGGGSFSSSSSFSTLAFPSLSVDIQAATDENIQSEWRFGRQIHRVPIPLRLMHPNQQYVYDPVTVSIGPYHHGKPHLRKMEEFKRVTLESFLSGNKGGRNKEFFYTKIYEQIGEIRKCYDGVSENEYDDAALSDMMLHDASFIIYFIAATDDETVLAHTVNHLGILTAYLADSDLNMLENQIPFWVIKFLMCSRFGEEEWKAMLRKHLSTVCFDDLDTLTTIPWEEGGGDDKKEPLHLLEATQRILVRLEQQSSDVPTSSLCLTEIQSLILEIFGQNIYNRFWNKKEDDVDYKILSRQFHSATYLKTKGIHFRPSSTSLNDVGFKSHSLYGKLLLPIRFVNPNDKVLLPNLIAFELSPKINIFDVPPHVTSYINFMKRLIENPKDVKELREQGILFSNLASDEEVVKLFQEIDTMGVHIDFFDDVKMSIKKHCKYCKARTWIAELINSKFRSPWTVTALLAATVLLILTFLQTFYTIRTAKTTVS